MLDHISIGVRDIKRARSFYDAALKPLGYACVSDYGTTLGYGAQQAALWVGEAKKPVPADPESGLHICFAAPTRASVDAFHAAAVAAGAVSESAPSLRPHDRVRYYAAFIVDVDGNRIEAVTFPQD